MIRKEDVYQIGHITRTHGVRGEVSLSFTDDVWDRVDSDFLILQVDGIMVPFFMEEYRFRSDTTALVKFQDYDTAEAAQTLVGCEVFFPLDLTPEDDGEEEYSWRHFTGFTLTDENAGLIGTIERVDDTTQNVLFQVGSHLIPAAEAWIVDVDHRQRTILMRLPEGLLEL